MKNILLAITLILLFPLTADAQRSSRKFRPVYGTDAEINRTIAFVSEHIVFDSLTYTRLSSLQGYIRCAFNVDTNGRVVDIKIMKGLANWIDYEILTSMGSLPVMEPFKDKSGRLIKVKRDVFFTFNGEEDNNWPNPYEKLMADNTTKSIEEQRKAIADKFLKGEKAWADFVKDNSKISMDGKTIYKPGVLPNNPLVITPPPARPPVNLTIKSE